MKKREGNRGQVKLSFGMIFSIILIIIFLVFAFFAIKSLLGLKSSAETGKFLNDLQSDVNRIQRSEQASQEEEYFLPSNVRAVCFADFAISGKGKDSDLYNELKRGFSGNENLVFYPIEAAEPGAAEIENIDLSETTKDENPFCLEAENGKIVLLLKKDFGGNLATITR